MFSRTTTFSAIDLRLTLTASHSSTVISAAIEAVGVVGEGSDAAGVADSVGFEFMSDEAMVGAESDETGVVDSV